MPSVIDTGSFKPENPFLQKLFDVAGDKTLHHLTGHTMPDESKGQQRAIFAKTVEGLKCLKGHKIVWTILWELEDAKTNRDFLEAMKKIEPLVRRVRQKLVEAQVLEWSSDSLSPLVVRRHEPTQAVSPLEKLQWDTTITNNAGIFFINNILPILWARRDEIQRRAHLVGEGVYREEMEFPAGFYGAISDSVSQKRKWITNPSLWIWRGVECRKGTIWFILLQLCSEHQVWDTISIDDICRKVEGPDVMIDDGMRKRIVGNMYAVLGKFPDNNKPFKIITKGAWIIINEDSATPETTPTAPDSGGFVMDADFLEQPLDPGTISLVSASKVSPASTPVPAPVITPVSTELSVDMVDTLNLSENAAKVLKYLLEKPDTTFQLSVLVAESKADSNIVISIGKFIEEINNAIRGKTHRIVQRRGNIIIFTATA